MTKSPSKLAANLGARIKHFRAAKGWPQDELARRSGLHRTYIGAVERAERNVTLLTVERIAEALEIEPLDLLDDSAASTCRR